MASTPRPKFVEIEGEYYHVRFRDPREFGEIRTPSWAASAAEEFVPGGKVRMGRRKRGDEWVVQSVLVPKRHGKATAERKARAVVEEIES